MSTWIEKLKDKLLAYAILSDEIIIISGYYSPNILADVASLGIETTFYYGMYDSDGITPVQHGKLGALETLYSNFKAYIVYNYHVHTKCYIFKKGDLVTRILVGSANASTNGLESGRNSEMLVDVLNPDDQAAILTFASEVASASVRYKDPLIVPTVRAKSSSKSILTPRGRIYSGNPFVDNIPLYVYNKAGKKEVLSSSGLNWGLQGGNVAKNSSYAEAYIPIKAYDIDTYPLIIPPLGTVGSGTGGKTTRRLGPVTVTWDDGTVMQMLFQGNGPTRPTPSMRVPGAPFREYPKQLTTNEGGAVLGEYLRNRLGVGGRSLITYRDLSKYGRDYITLTLVSAGNYEADFHS